MIAAMVTMRDRQVARDEQPGGDRRATQCLEVDHVELDVLLREAEQAAGAGRFAEAGQHFARFSSGLLRHIEAEENVLFPALRAADGRTVGPISVMRFEHEEFRELLATIAAELLASAETWRDSVWRLKQELIAHNTKEERVLYPMADEAALSEGCSAAWADKLRAALDGKSLSKDDVGRSPRSA
jgi:iron-sulfur cluster repair protein YtfE (RIC family)